MSPAACHAAYTSDPDLLNPKTIHFHDQSTGLITRWQWSFGDGVTSTIQNPDHTYPSSGTYMVCLTVSNSDSGNICHDILCTTVIIPQVGECKATFNYQVDNSNKQKVTFINTSTGNINHWHWEFGDGDVSGDKNPVHIYPGFGDYHVCLTVYNSDSIAVCNDRFCDSVRLTPAPACEAAYTGILDSLNPNPNTFVFVNESVGENLIYNWEFDDGTMYHARDVTHQFTIPGSHLVCLTIKQMDQSVVICSDTICKFFSTATYYNLGGHLFAGDLPINNPVMAGDTGIAYLFRFKKDKIILVDTLNFTYLGYYAFPNILPGSYLIRAELTSGSFNHSHYFPSYYPRQLNWVNTDPLIIADSNVFAANTHLLSVVESLDGPGQISGLVDNVASDGLIAEIPFAQVNLLDGNFHPLTFILTDSLGHFELGNLPLGAYQLYVEYPGKYSRYTAIWLDDNKPVITGVRLELFNHDITGNPEEKNQLVSFGNLYPNPTHSTVTLPVNASYSTPLTIEVRNLIGISVLSAFGKCVNGSTLITLPIESIPTGIYFLTVRQSDNTLLVTKKFIKY
ncbi:MAG: PKD domain-containing protein [Bacteroidales bacterium]|nr:PKD domain-containing protein [Bacteroidales bacterium]